MRRGVLLSTEVHCECRHTRVEKKRKFCPASATEEEAVLAVSLIAKSLQDDEKHCGHEGGVS